MDFSYYNINSIYFVDKFIKTPAEEKMQNRDKKMPLSYPENKISKIKINV